MIFSSLSIKILGCMVVALVIIATPTIISIKKTARQKEIDASFDSYFAKGTNNSLTASNFIMNPGETFSNDKFKDGQPSADQQKYVVNNGLEIIPKMPIKFFESYSNTNGLQPKFTNTFLHPQAFAI